MLVEERGRRSKRGRMSLFFFLPPPSPLAGIDGRRKAQNEDDDTPPLLFPPSFLLPSHPLLLLFAREKKQKPEKRVSAGRTAQKPKKSRVVGVGNTADSSSPFFFIGGSAIWLFIRFEREIFYAAAPPAFPPPIRPIHP